MGRLIMALIGLGLVAWLIGFIGLPQPFDKIIWVVLILCAVYLVLVAFGLLSAPAWWKGNGNSL